MIEIEESKSKVNLRDIKSLYNIKVIMSFLKEAQKLNLIIYNKQIQNMLNINIRDYKKISGKYKIIESNGEGIEYILDTDKILFKGSYLNGKRNGVGKEYNIHSGKLDYFGEYIKGKRQGKGKEYYNNGHLKFEGE